MDALNSSGTYNLQVSLYHITRLNVSEDRQLYIRRREDLKTCSEHKASFIQFPVSFSFSFRRGMSEGGIAVCTKLRSGDTGQEEGIVTLQSGSAPDTDRVCHTDEGWLNPSYRISVFRGMITRLETRYKPSINYTIEKKSP